MSKSDTFENDLLKLTFLGTPITGIADAPASPLSGLVFSLHTADVGEAGNQSTNEVTGVTGYARKSVAIGAGSFTVTGNTVTLAAVVTFDPCTVGTAAATHWALGTATSGTGKVLYKGALSPTINIAPGVTPQFSGITITED